jgi:hypothetical protein
LALEDLAHRAYRMDISLIRCDDGLAASVNLEASATEAGSQGRHIDRKFLRKLRDWFEAES